MIPFICTVVFLTATAGAASKPSVDFARDIRPILNRHCAECHGGVKQASGISFVYRDQVFGRGKSGRRPVVPGDLQASELYRRITSPVAKDRMPPVDEHPAGLSAQEIAIIKRWIAAGAPWSDHWAFVAPRRPSLPNVSNADWPLNGIDRFILAKLEAENMTPAPDADPQRWLRRASLDLTGLPPTPEEREAFLTAAKKRGESAYADAVDRLLVSPHYGERQATIWLDLVRYADSKGLGQDGRRTIWKYRDWVIDAFNNDMPYDEFTLRQVAGDLLPDATIEDHIATAVHRLTHSNEEGGTDDEEFRVLAVIDRVNTTWQTWQGLTFGCAQCHNHPYDPIRQEDYYKFFAFFNNTRDIDLTEEWPVLRAPVDPSRYPEATRLDRRIKTLTERIWTEELTLLDDPHRWQALRNIEVKSNKPTQVAVVSKPTHDEFHTVDAVSKETDYTVTAPIPSGVDRLTALRLVGLPLDPERAVAHSSLGFVLSHIEARLLVPGMETPRALSFVHVITDEPRPFFDPRESLNPKSKTGFAAYTKFHYPRSAAFILNEPLEIPEDSRIEIVLKHRVRTFEGFAMITKRAHLAVSGDRAFTDLTTDPRLSAQRTQLATLKSRRDKIPAAEVPILAERLTAFQRPTHVFERGLFLNKALQVAMDTPKSFPPPASDLPLDRRALAHWLTAADNPLTARVAVNRQWARLFGIGLVATEEDFGSSGEPPSHPGLLDYLAIRFRDDHQWSIKSLLREIVLSRTYRQSSRTRPELAERDPLNRLLARGPRHRLPAETVRDQALAASGLLKRSLFGPPVHPPIPAGVWDPFQAKDKWLTAEPNQPGRYRRSLYTYTKRSIPYPMFAAFDAPSREFCAPRRLRSNTPLQALMTLNDQTFLECSHALAERMKNAVKDDLEQQLRHGYLLTTAVEPSQAVLAELKNLHRETMAQYARGGQEESPYDAALVVVANTLLNLDEALMK